MNDARSIKQSSRNTPSPLSTLRILASIKVILYSRTTDSKSRNNKSTGRITSLMPPPPNAPNQINLHIQNVEEPRVRTLSPLIKFTLSVVFRDFNQVEDIVLLILIHQGKIAAEWPSIRKLSVGDGDTFAYPLPAIGFGDGNRGFVRIG